ncbi:MAG: hypothetical protein KIH09_17510 [Candidatus Freyarchaeota archaeon]|nr:hypothetical protein [Candidatus Jordarchaeia archaeon]
MKKMADDETIQAVQKELDEINSRLNDQEIPLTIEEREKLEEERRQLENYLCKSRGLRGRIRNFRDEIDKLRTAIQNALQRAYQQLKKAGMETLVEHFQTNIGASGPSYRYSNRLPWVV